jgi:YggT family protein
MVLLDTVTAVEHFLDVFVGVYTLAIFLYVIVSWIPLPYSLRPAQRFLDDVCEPYIRLWRRILPTAGPIDLSPIVAVIGLVLIDRVGFWILEQLH